jgi:protein-tyrosine phosphatase
MRLFLSFLIAAAVAGPGGLAMARTAAAAAHDRVLPLQGGQNFRDLGGYRTADGRTVKWGMLYRSGSMHDLTPADFTALAARGIRTVCDFRDNKERASAPVAWPDAHVPAVLADDYDLDLDLRAFAQPGLDGPKARAIMAAFYTKLPFQFAGAYRRMFAELAAGHAPLAFNCSAGKDRTGVAAALLLSVLGVPYETVAEDYLLSNRTFDPTRAVATDPRAAAFYRQLPPDALKALMGVDRSYLDAAFAAIRARPGGIEGYYRDQLGLDAAAIRKLRAAYLER